MSDWMKSRTQCTLCRSVNGLVTRGSVCKQIYEFTRSSSYEISQAAIIITLAKQVRNRAKISKDRTLTPPPMPRLTFRIYVFDHRISISKIFPWIRKLCRHYFQYTTLGRLLRKIKFFKHKYTHTFPSKYHRYCI